MTTDEIYNYLNMEHSLNDQRRSLISYLKQQVYGLPDDPADRLEVAYQMAGLMSTQYIQSMDQKDSMNDIFSIAGELEVPDQYSQKDWVELISLINKL